MDDSTLQSPFRMFMFTIRPHRSAVALMLTLIVVGNVCSYSIPYFLKQIADIAVRAGTAATFSDFLVPFLVVVGLFISAEICFRIGHLIETVVSPNLFGRSTAALFSWVLERPAAYFEERLSGELSRRVEQVGLNAQFFIEYFPWEVGWPIVAACTAVVLLALANIQLALVFLAWLVLFLATSYPLLRWQYRAAEALATTQANLSGMTVDSFGNVGIIHAFGAQTHEEHLYAGYLADAVRADRQARFAGLINKLQQGLSVIVLGVSLTAASIVLFIHTRLTVGDFVLVGTTVATIAGGVVWTLGDLLVRAIRNYGELKSALQSFESTVTKLPEGTKALAAHNPSISFEHVSFSYPSTNVEAVSGVTLHVRASEKIGLVGKSGAGKSTLIKLLLRQYDPVDGVISIGDDNIGDVTLASLRHAITFVPQDTSLFQRTLYENILYAKPEASQTEVFAAAKHAYADDFIRQYPAGYDTKVGERGVKLSGGQRQRIALARAMLKDAPILVLDEATSALDSESEAAVQEGLQELFADKTVIAIAHRLSTLRAMDRIVVLDAGRVIEDGSPQELLARPESRFKAMWEHQKSGFIS